MVAEWLASEHVGQVHLDERYGYRRKSVAQRDAGMGEGTGIAQDQGSLVVPGLVDAVDQFVFGIGLEPDQFVPHRLRAPGQRLVDRGQGFGPVELRLTCTQQIEIGPMQDQDLGHETVQLASGCPGTGRSVRAPVDVVQFTVDRRCLTEKCGIALRWRMSGDLQGRVWTGASQSSSCAGDSAPA